MIDTPKGKLPIRYSTNALAMFGDLTDRPMNDIFNMSLDTLKLSELLIFIHVGLIEGARKKGEECAVKDVREIGDMIDEDAGLIDKVMKAFAEQYGSTEGEGKKK